MLGIMPTPKRKRTDAKQQNRHKEPREAFHLPPSLREALESYIERTRPRPVKSAVLRLALEEFLERQGLWPPSDEPK